MPQAGKSPKTIPTPDRDSERVSWRFGYLDIDGAWTCAMLGQADAFRVKDGLLPYEQKTWMESVGTGSVGTQKRIPVADLGSDAQHRLEELELDDEDALVEFRISYSERVWGVRRNDVCYLLWWDPDHEVCPGSGQ